MRTRVVGGPETETLAGAGGADNQQERQLSQTSAGAVDFGTKLLVKN